MDEEIPIERIEGTLRNNFLPDIIDNFEFATVKDTSEYNKETLRLLSFGKESYSQNQEREDNQDHTQHATCSNTSLIDAGTKSNNMDCNAEYAQLQHRGQINVIDMRMEQNSSCKYFFVYEDKISKFVVLESLESNTAEEVAKKLLGVLSIIGVPQVLQSNNGRKFAEEIVRELRLLWADFIIVHGEIPKDERDTRDFKKLLKTWLQRNPTKTWHEGLKSVQIIQNTTFTCDNEKVPYDILFGRNVHKEFWDFTNAIESKNIWSEEEWMSFMKTKTENNVNSFVLEKPEPDFNVTESVHVNNVMPHDGNYDSDSQTENREEPIRDENGFNFVNVKSEIPFNIQTEDTIFEDEATVDTKTKAYNDIEDLKCKICQKQYMKAGHLKNHMRTHGEGMKFECTLCDKTFHVLSLYEKHMRQSHGKIETSTLSRTRRKKNSISNTTFDDTVNEELSMEKLNTTSDLSSPEVQANSTNTASKRKLSADNRTAKLNEESSLECTYCKQKFNFPSVLKRHIRSHTNERPYICEVCNKSFKQLGHLSQHSLTHKDYRSFQCAVCGVKFESLDTLKIHSQSHKGESVLRTKESYRLFECDSCKKVFTTKSVLERHIFTHTHERQFGCKVCGKRFKQAGHVKSHMLVHTGERKFQCTVCSKRFSLSNSLKKHMYVHNGEKPYQCDVCGARFLEKRNLNGHLMTHTNERPFRCKICGKRYTLADTLRRHISAAHEDGRTYQCEICAKMFKQLAHLSVHKKVHNDERPFQCHLCEKNFKHKNVLKSHLAIHANVRPFECDDCKATFVRKTNLQTHIASAHMNERPYVCTICGKRFKQISHLNGHVVVHSNSMPYQCDFCDRRCNRLDNLKKHMRLHSKNKE